MTSKDRPPALGVHRRLPGVDRHLSQPGGLCHPALDRSTNQSPETLRPERGSSSALPSSCEKANSDWKGLLP